MSIKKYILKNITLTIIVFFVVVLLWLMLNFFITNEIRFEFSLPKKQTIAEYNGVKGESDTDTIWCGTFNIAWNELVEKIGHKVEFENYESDFVNKLNEQVFTKDMISDKDYYIKVGNSSSKVKEEILQSIDNKFKRNEKKIFDRVNFEENKITVYSLLNKGLDLTVEFSDMGIRKIGNTDKKVRCFGLPFGEKDYENVDVIYFDRIQDETEPTGDRFLSAIRLNIKENEEIIFVNTISNKSFEELYEEIIKLEKEYTGVKELQNIDMFVAPYIKLDMLINYTELCGKEIKGTNDIVLENAIQSINFSTNPNSNKLYYDVEITTDFMGSSSYQTSWSREFNFCNYDSCYVFVKEKDKNKPYLSLKLNEDFVETIK